MAWRFSFDPLTGDLWEADVGQDLFEEVNVIRRGGNYGWNVFEGFEPYSNKHRREREKYVMPIFAYARKYGASVTGGVVYPGSTASPFFGVFVFGDYQSWAMKGRYKNSTPSTPPFNKLASPPAFPPSPREHH